MNLLQQLRDLRAAQSQFTQAAYHWEKHEEDEPRILPDIGAKDGLRGERWAMRAGRWAYQRGHKPLVATLPERKVVSGVGGGSHHAAERVWS